MRILEYNIEEGHHGLSVQDYLRQEHGYSRRMMSALKQKAGGITCNGDAVKVIEALRAGDILRADLSEHSEIVPNPALSVPVVYEDPDVIVFDKPYGMPVHPSVRHYEDTLGNYYMAHLHQNGEQQGYHPINRLDRDTTGLCLVAKHAYAAHRLSGKVQKTYTAVVCGSMPEDTGEISAPIAREADSIIKRVVSPDGQPSITRYQVLKRGNGYTTVQIRLLTGRTHQIRVHFSHIGYPLAGDSLYGGDIRILNTHALTCTELIFIHPVTKRELQFCINIHKIYNKVYKINK